MDGLPFQPGNTFKNPAQTKYHRSQTLNYKNGYIVPKHPQLEVGGSRVDYNQLSDEAMHDLIKFDPTLTYGQAKQAPPVDFVPSFVAFDKKVLRYNGYFKETVHESPQEYYRVRPVDIYYYLEDDSISVIEPTVKNSGIPQGKLISRQRLPKDDQGRTWHWKDLNLGMNVTFYGKVFRITDCDRFTKDFLESEGIEVNEQEMIPKDPYIEKRTKNEELKLTSTPSDWDKTRQFLEMDRKVLRFYAVWDDRDNMFGEMRPYIIHYYLVDDTMEVRESHQANDGRDPFPVLIGRHRVPKDRYNVKPSHPSITMELTQNEIGSYFTPRDFEIGKTVFIYGRKFLIHDIDEFTKAFYYQNFGKTDFNPIDVKERKQPLPKMEIPPYNNFGSMEDSLQNCLSLIPEPAKKDFIKMMDNDGKNLRFEAILDSVKPEDQGRRFILTYRLADDMLSIYEPPVRNSGIRGGKFLERSRIAKPGSQPDKPTFYGPQDFTIGSTIQIFENRFIITNCDEFVLKFMEENASQFPGETIESVRNCIGQTEPKEIHPKLQPINVKREEGDLDAVVSEVSRQLKKLSIIGKARVDELFLLIDRDRTGVIDKIKLKAQLKHMHLPVDDDVLNAVLDRCSTRGDREIALEDFRRFVENP